MSPSSATDIEIVALERVEITRASWSWRFAVERRDEIERHFAELQRRRPAVWNGRILLLKGYTIEGSALHGSCFETDFASFCSWRDWGFPDASVYNVFATAALCSADGAFLLGEMAASTANAGLLTFPCGTPEPGDLDNGGTLELARHLGRELMEEVGIDLHQLAVAPGWTMVRDRGYLALVKQLTAPQSAEALRARVAAYIAGEQNPEFTAVRVVRSPADFDPAMPRFVTAFLTHFFGA